MPRLGLLECSRCKLSKLQDEAKERGMVITLRKSLYGITVDKYALKPKKAGVDIYIHPKSITIPSNHKCYHDLAIDSFSVLSDLLPDSDPDKWIAAWFAEVPDRCECRIF